jgi:hypothetical protein
MAENSAGAKSLQRRWAIVLAMAAFVAGMGLYGVHMIHEGFSARDTPSRVEVLVARKARHWAIPSKANNLRNPMSATSRDAGTRTKPLGGSLRNLPREQWER